MARLTPSQEKREIQRCSSDFHYFCRHLNIVDKVGRLRKLSLHPAQQRYVATAEESNWMYILKARQLGMTTAIAARFFWMALFKPHFQVAVLAHRIESAQSIFEVYRRFYNYLPEHLKFRTEKSNVRELKFFHGGLIRVSTANSENFRGTTHQALHCSEFAFWDDPEKTVASAFQTCGPNAEVVLETTANGMNDAHSMWNKEMGYSKLFFPWSEDPGYISTDKPKGYHPHVENLSKEFDLAEPQKNWAQRTFETKCMSNWQTFLQEYPLSAEQAFITSGERFFDQVFPNVQSFPGYRCYEKHESFKVYSIGVDSASGSPSGDYSAFCVIDVTDKENPAVVSTYYNRLSIHEFSERVHEEAMKYEALIVVESNSYGLAVLENLISKGYSHLYRRTQFDKMAGRWVEKLGFNTNSSSRPVMLSRLHEYTAKRKLPINDDRMKCEMNTFVYNARGKPEAESKKHDDMVFAHALALQGMDQIEPLRQERTDRFRPSKVSEVLQFELRTGSIYRGSPDDYEQERWGVPENESSPIDAAFNNSPTRR